MDRAINMGDINIQSSKTLHGNRVCNSAKIAIGTTTTKIKTVAAIDYTIDGQVYTLAATDDFFVNTDLTVQPIASTKYYALCVDAAGAGSIIAGPNNLTAAVTAQTNKSAVPAIPDTKCLVGIIKVVTVGSVFTPATTAYTGITTYYNVAAVPTAGVPV
jgi:hypothetical protein